jgi:von Willebrand factor type A domain
MVLEAILVVHQQHQVQCKQCMSLRDTLKPQEDIAPRNDIGPRRDLAPRKDLDVGSRPPPQKRPSTSSLSILFVMGLVVVGAFIASGSITPVDPNGPGGPPTLQPYYNPADYPAQHIITPTGGFQTGKQNLQLQTFQVDNCGENSAILFVIDTSGSMSYANKMVNTKNALKYFMSKMGGKSVIGIDTFSKDVHADIPLNYYSDAKTKINQVIDGLKPDGWTSTRDALQMAYGQLKDSITNEDYPGYSYNVVLMTDGVPEIPDQPRTCEVQVPEPLLASGVRCFAQEEDPRVPVNIPDEIKNLGVDVYAINVYSTNFHSDVLLFPYLDTLLKQVASQPTASHYFVSTNASNLSQILQNIGSSICYKNFN